MLVQILFPDHAEAAIAKGHRVVDEAQAEAVVVGVDPLILITPRAWDAAAASYKRLLYEERSQRLKACGKAGRPHRHTTAELKAAVAAFGSVRAAARTLGIGRNTFARRLKKGDDEK